MQDILLQNQYSFYKTFDSVHDFFSVEVELFFSCDSSSISRNVGLSVGLSVGRSVGRLVSLSVGPQRVLWKWYAVVSVYDSHFI